MGCLLFHKWGDWEAVPGKCEEKQVCAKCGDVKTRVSHKMSDWAPVPGQCKKESRCTNPWCNYVETKDTPHTFGEWSYYEDGCCTQIRRCTVCGKPDYREKCPDAVETIEAPGECRVIKRCPRCGVETTEALPHDWTDRLTLRDCYAFRIEQNGAVAKEIKVLPIPGRDEGGMGENIALKNKLLKEIAKDTQQMTVCPPGSGRVCKRCMMIQKLGRRED